MSALGKSLLINAAGAALIDHHLRAHGQDISLLPQAVMHILNAHGMRTGRSGVQHLAITNDEHVRNRVPDATKVRFVTDAGELNMPPLLGSIKEDDDEDLVLTLREMMVTQEVFYNAIPSGVRIVSTGRLPETLATAVRGRPLSDVVSHPALDGRGITVVSVENMPEGQTFNLRGSPPLGAAITISPAGKIVLPMPGAKT